ncbi:DegT/DnrJ/EryC1/StrS family aminotransferase, partial [bacterium]|nr:DegT/DnrJ/EryC1/StrS family aminotransferase [bacterium]
FGIPAPLDEIKTLASEFGARIVEDSACAAGTKVNGVPLGCQSGVGILSFHPRKMVTTGEGGALLTDDQGLAERVRSFVNHGFGRDKEVLYPGMNLRLPEISCALGLSQLGDLDERVQRRNCIGHVYRERYSVEFMREPPWHEMYGMEMDWPVFFRPSREGILWNHQTVCALFGNVENAKPPIQPGTFVELMRAKGIEVSFPAQILSARPLYKKLGSTAENFPHVAAFLQDLAFAVPCHEKMAAKDAEYICDVLTELLI